MLVRWFGQSAFLLSGSSSVFIDPFGPEVASLGSRGIEFRYPPIEGVSADLVLVTHEHRDHNGVGVVAGEPVVIRQTAGTLESPVGEVIAIASEHDGAAGTARGPNTIFRLELDGVALCHLGDFGQPALRSEQRRAIGDVDVLFVPVGGGPTIGGAEAAALVRELRPSLVVPMHYRTDAVNFLEPVDGFLEALGARVERAEGSEAELDYRAGSPDEPLVLVLAAPVA
jgi:L-ascorbate metabolism protein UlaG (beta-lactamase superfamily)